MGEGVGGISSILSRKYPCTPSPPLPPPNSLPNLSFVLEAGRPPSLGTLGVKPAFSLSTPQTQRRLVPAPASSLCWTLAHTFTEH